MRKRWQVLERRIKRYKKNSVTLSDSKKRSKLICSDATLHKSATQKHIRVRPIAPFSALLHPQFAPRVPPHHQFFGNNFPGMLPIPHSFHSMYPPSFTSGVTSFHIPHPVINQCGTNSFATKRVSKLKPHKIIRHSDTSISVDDIDFTCDESFDVILRANDSNVGTAESFSRVSNNFVDNDDFDNKSKPTKKKHAEQIPRIVVEKGASVEENVASFDVGEKLLLSKTNFVAPTVQEVQSGGKSHSISVKSLQKCLKAIDRVADATKGGLSVYFNRNEVDEEDIEMEDLGDFNDDTHSQYSAEHYGSMSDPGSWECEWGKYYEIFKNIYNEHGSCNSIDSTHPVLGSWVTYQRVQYQNLIAGKESTLTMNQVRLLQDIGFVFDTKKYRRESLNQQKRTTQPKRRNPLPQHLSHLPVAKRLCLDKYPKNLSNSQSTSRFVVVNDSGVKLAKLIQNEQLHSTDFVFYIVAQLDICRVSKNFGEYSPGLAFQTGDGNSRKRGLRCGHCKSRHFVYQNFQGLSRSFCRGIAQHLEVSKLSNFEEYDFFLELQRL